MKKIILLIFSTTFILANENFTLTNLSNDYLKRDQKEKIVDEYISVGILDHKTGFSLVGYSRTLMKNEKFELFIGTGTSIAIFTLSAGYKYHFENEPFKYYYVFSIHSTSTMGGGFVAPVVSFGIEKNLSEKLYFNAGINSLIRIYSQGTIEFLFFPNITLNFQL